MYILVNQMGEKRFLKLNLVAPKLVDRRTFICNSAWMLLCSNWQCFQSAFLSSSNRRASRCSRVSKIYQELPRVTKSYIELHRVTKSYQVRVTKSYQYLSRVTKSYQDLPRVTKSPQVRVSKS